MTRQCWTTPKEREWLLKRKAAFQEAQQNQTTSQFYSQVYEEWAKDFSIPQPTADEIAEAGSEEAAARAKRKALEKRLFQWFHNNTRPTAAATKEGVIPVSKPTKIPAPWQAYQKLFYEKKLRAIVDAEFDAHQKSLKEGEKAKSRIQIQTEVSWREYAKESEEVKAEVEAYRRKLAGEAESNLTVEQQAQRYQVGVSRVQKTLLTYMKTLEEATGWSFCVLAGGPNPEQGGKINRVLYETATEGDSGLTFEGTLGSKEWKSVLGKWNEHLHEVFPENVRKQRSCSNSPTPAPDENSQTSVEDPKPDENNQRSAEGPKPDTQEKTTKETVESESQEKQAGKADESVNNAKNDPSSAVVQSCSDYEARKKQNIARNLKLLRQILGDDVWGKDELSKDEEKNEKMKGGKSQDNAASSDPVSESPHDAANDKAERDTVVAGPTDAVMTVSVQEDGEENALGTPMDVDQVSINTSTALDETGVSIPSPSTPSSNIPNSESGTDITTESAIPKEGPCTPTSCTPASTSETRSDQPPTNAGVAKEGADGLSTTPSTEALPPQLSGSEPSVSTASGASVQPPPALETPAPSHPFSKQDTSSTPTSLSYSNQDTSKPTPIVPSPALDDSPSGALAQTESLPSTVSAMDGQPATPDITMAAASSNSGRETELSAHSAPAPEIAPPQGFAPPPATLETTPTSPAAAAGESESPNKGVTPVVDFATFSAAGYITDEETFLRLPNMCRRPSWKTLVETWAIFETRYRNNGPIPTKPRPTEIAAWMKYNRKFNRLPKIIKPADFIVAWRQWWMAMQPDWRAQDKNWPPSRDVPPGRHWAKIAHTGPNGVFLLIISLGWWGKMVAAGNADEVEYDAAVEDVTWVLSLIIGTLPDMPAKRSLADEGDLQNPPSKRARKSL